MTTKCAGDGNLKVTGWVKLLPLRVCARIRRFLDPDCVFHPIEISSSILAQGPGLHYGAHDSAPPAFNLPNVDQVFVSPDKAVRIADAQFHLLTVVINSTKVTFYVDKTSFGPYPLPRPVTDCNNNHQGIQIGSPGLSMRQLRFYIGAFQPEEVHELFNYGQRLADISTGSDPFSKSSAELNEAMMQSSIDSTMAETAAQTQALSSSQSEVITILRALDDQAGITQNYKSPIYPVGKTRPSSYSGVDHHVASRVIHQTENRSYFSVISEPSRLSRTSSADARLLEHLPRFNGTGATFSYWYRHPKVFSCFILMKLACLVKIKQEKRLVNVMFSQCYHVFGKVTSDTYTGKRGLISFLGLRQRQCGVLVFVGGRWRNLV